jgi:hypothetical protein
VARVSSKVALSRLLHSSDSPRNMAYFTNLFTTETYEAFWNSDRSICGFRESQMSMAARVKKGDRLVAYIKGVSRWAGVAEVEEGPFVDKSPLFVREGDPFVVRFKVKSVGWLALENAIPMREAEVFQHLTFTRGREKGYWLGPLRRSLQHLVDDDGRLLETLITSQLTLLKTFPLEEQRDSPKPKQVRRADGVVDVTVPRDDGELPAVETGKASRDSIKNQADLARLGEAMGFRIWIPRNDRAAVTQHWSPADGVLLDLLPLNYDDATLETIEQIDVLWLKGRAIQRAFEVEHTTAIYSGLLRMADLLALQPNMNIALHIVAPAERREKVLSEIRRPVFSLLENQPLSKRCTYLAYEDLRDIMALKHLSHLSDSVLEEYHEIADEYE